MKLNEQIEESYRSGRVIEARLIVGQGEGEHEWRLARRRKDPDTAAVWYINGHPDVQKVEVCALTLEERVMATDAPPLVLQAVYQAEACLQGLYAQDVESLVKANQAQRRQMSYEKAVEKLVNK